MMSDFFKHLSTFRRWIWLLIAVAILNALLNIGVIVSEDLAHHQEVNWIFYIINEFTGSFVAVLFVPILFYVFKVWPLERPHLMTRIVGYVFISMIFGFLFTSLMYLSRVPLYHLAGITRLEEIFNDLPYRYLMEYFKQFFTFWLFYIVYWAITQYQSNRDRQLREAELKGELLKAQVQSLQMQLHPHFFFNTLNTISSVMYKDPERADKLISRLGDFLRNVLGLRDQVVHSLEEELVLVNQFTDVMLERYPDKLKVNYLIEEKARKCEVPVLLLQPIVENAIRYAIDFRRETKVSIRAKHQENQLYLQVEDNGPGIQEGAVSPGTGLSATLLRLEKLYGEAYTFAIQNGNSQGVTVHISFPEMLHTKNVYAVQSANHR